ncbi:MAG TPA: YsnF/AvaK domain-containing protein [Thermomicrobiales bacterium]|nr:YsnF/AvaK domain-containing protein [Thermomicrobiales bacterium]
MSVTVAGYDIQEGTPVIARDGTEVGSVAGEDQGKLLVNIYDENRNLLLPPQAISLFDQDFVMVDLTPDWLRTGNWGSNGAQQLDENGRTVIDIHEEELVAAKREIARGLVTVHKRVITENQTFEVPVTEERINVVRTDLDREATADTGDAFKEGEYDIELMGEEVELQKRVRVTGQVEIDKEPVQDTQTVTGQRRREEVDVEETDFAGERGAVTNPAKANKTGQMKR